MLQAPFPWFGGKRKVAAEVWRRFGTVQNYVEPFFGSGAVLLGRPAPEGIETVNDLDGLVANFWRAVQHNPDQVADYADQPVNENDLHARHIWLVHQLETLRMRLEGDPEYYDPKVAGYWVWGLACWIGSAFCSGKGPWTLNSERQLVHLGDAGQGIHRKLVHLSSGRGIHRKRVHLSNAGRGIRRQRDELYAYFRALCDRLRHVRVCSGDWSRVCGPAVTYQHGMTGVFLDPPYSDAANRDGNLYRTDCLRVAHDVREWAIANGEHPLLRIAVCGYEGEHMMPASWAVHVWNAGQGYGSQATERTGNGRRERIWFSPACLTPAQGDLFDAP